MRNYDLKWRPYVLMVWPILLLVRFASRHRIDELARIDFWLGLGRPLLGIVAFTAVVGGCFYGYLRFCFWFDRAIEAKRAKISERVAMQNGEVTWPASDPLHDAELDG